MELYREEEEEEEGTFASVAPLSLSPVLFIFSCVAQPLAFIIIIFYCFSVMTITFK